MSIDRFASYLQIYHSLTPDDVEPTGTPGYWRIKQPCGGKGRCLSPLHYCLGYEGPIRHTIDYLDDYRDEKGRFVSPYRTWKTCRMAHLREATDAR